jgi:hypothetical protein
MQAIQMMQSMAPQPPPDPAIAAAQAETERRAKADQMKAQMDQQRMQFEHQMDQLRLQFDQQVAQAKLNMQRELEQMQEQREDTRLKLDVQSRISMNDADNRTAMDLALLNIEHGQTANPSQNPNPNGG